MAPSGTKRAGVAPKRAPNPPAPANPLAAAPPKICLSCEQSSHDADRDSAEPIFVAWAKTLVVGHQRVPKGEECYRCFDVRRRFFKQVAMEELLHQRRACRKLEERFLELRRDRTSGENRFKNDEAIDIQQFVPKVNSAYKDRFEEGAFHELWAFARQRHLAYTKEQEGGLIQFIQESLGMEVVEDEDGIVGVEILDHSAGQYRLKRGRQQAIERKQREGFQDKAAAVERFESLASKRSMRSEEGGTSSFHPIGITSPQEKFSGCSLAEIDDDAGTECSEARRLAFETTPITLRSAAKSCRPASMGRPPSPALSRASAASASTASASLARGTSSARFGATTGGGEEDPVGDGAKKRRKTSKECILETTQSLLEKTSEEMTWEKHWDTKNRKRDFDAMVARVTTQGRRSGSLIGNERAAGLSQRCFVMAEMLQNRQDVFDKIRTGFVHFCLGELSEQDRKTLCEAPGQLLVSIITMHAQQLIDRVTFDMKYLDAFVSLLSVVGGNGQGIGFWLIKGHDVLVEQAQRGLTLAFAEKVWKSFDASAIAAMTRRLQDVLPKAAEPLDHIDISSAAPLKCGWFAQSWVDMPCVVVCGNVLGAMSSDGGVSRALRQECVAIMKVVDKITPRLKSNFKKLNGAQVQHGKAAWDMVAQVNAEFEEQSAEGGANNLDIMVGIADRLGAATTWSASYDVMVDIVEGNGEQVRRFGKAFGGAPPSDDQEGPASTLAQRMSNGLAKAINLVLEESGFLALFWQKALLGNLQTNSDEANTGAGDDQSDADGYDTMKWFSSAVETLRCFVSSGEDLLLEACMRADAGLMIWEAFSDFNVEKDVPNAVHSLSKAWQKQLSIKSCIGGAPQEHLSIKSFIEKAATKENISVAIVRFVSDLVAGGGEQPVSAVRGRHLIEDFLPKDLCIVTKAAGVLDRLSDTAARFQEGKQIGGLLEVTALLSEVADVRKVAPTFMCRRQGFNTNEAVVAKEWRTMSASHLAKYEDMAEVKTFMGKYAHIVDAASEWVFTKCPWVRVESSPEQEAEAKRIEALVSQFSVWKTVTERVSQYASWAPEDEQLKVKAAVDGLDASQKALGSVALVLSCMVLCSLVVGSEIDSTFNVQQQLQAGLKYTTGMLKVKEEDLPTMLREKMQSASATSSGDGGHESVVQSASSAARAPDGARPRRRLKRTRL